MPTSAPIRKRSSAADKLNKDMWTLTIEGICGIRDKGQFVEKQYRVAVIMPDVQLQKGALSQFVRNYAPRLMPKLLPTYQNLFTHEIVKAECSNPEKENSNIHVMPREGLLVYIRENELPVDIELYGDTDELRQAIKECIDPKTSEGFEERQTLRREKIGERIGDSKAAVDYIDASLAKTKEMFAELGQDL